MIHPMPFLCNCVLKMSGFQRHISGYISILGCPILILFKFIKTRKWGAFFKMNNINETRI